VSTIVPAYSRSTIILTNRYPTRGLHTGRLPVPGTVCSRSSRYEVADIRRKYEAKASSPTAYFLRQPSWNGETQKTARPILPGPHPRTTGTVVHKAYINKCNFFSAFLPWRAHKLGSNNQTLASETHRHTDGGVSENSTFHWNPVLSAAKCGVLVAGVGTSMCRAPLGPSEGHCLSLCQINFLKWKIPTKTGFSEVANDMNMFAMSDNIGSHN
jgi:hypothetical protein